jgi:hypothetical protein
VHGSTRSWWQEEAPPDDALPPLVDDVDADVAIVGGGAAVQLPTTRRVWCRP